MPRGDRTGPLGQGTMTGRGAGFCAGYEMPGFANIATGRGAGWSTWCKGGLGNRNRSRLPGFLGRQGGGRYFFRQSAQPTWIKENEILALRDELAVHEAAMEQIRAHIARWEKAE